MGLEFRTLNANEIECRPATINGNGLSLLLYKDARVDQNILDETVGAMNWQRHHSRDNANCTVAIWDKEKSQWIEKEDTGTESFTEKEKGLASDSFKRACFNWGIGRELYSAPFIWIKSNSCCIEPTGRKDTKGKDIFVCKDKLYVEDIEYDENRNIVALFIKNASTGVRVYSMDSRNKTKQTSELNEQKKAEEEQKKIAASLISEVKVKALISRCDADGVDSKKICRLYKVNSLADLTELKYSNINTHWGDIKKAE